MVPRVMLTALVSLIVAACTAGVPTPSPTRAQGTPTPSASPSGGVPSVSDTEAAAVVARAFLDALARGDTGAAEAMEDDTMRTAAPAATLGQLWQQLVGQFGAFGGFGDTETTHEAPYLNATVQATFANVTVPLIVTVTADGRVAGLHLGAAVPAGSGSPSVSPSTAAYVRPDSFTETDVTVGSSPWALPGTLTMPTGGGPFPAVVLLAGSGPQDRDETVGPNAPLRDLAWGLASSGIAVLRYDKRTKAHGAAMAADVANLTVREETTDDAVAAVDLLRTTAGVDPARVFVVGHSLGGYLAPRIAAEVPGRVAGIAMIETPSSRLAPLILRQVEYLASAEGGADQQASAELAALRDQVARAESPDLSPSTAVSELPLGIPAAYWIDLRSYDPLASARALSIPIFIAQGGRDYQVPPDELDGWRTVLSGRDDVAIHEYPALNHLLMAGSGPSRPAEYSVGGHVAAELVADLAAWILAS